MVSLKNEINFEALEQDLKILYRKWHVTELIKTSPYKLMCSEGGLNISTRENISLPVDKQVILSSEELGNIANILISQTGKCWENLG